MRTGLLLVTLRVDTPPPPPSSSPNTQTQHTHTHPIPLRSLFLTTDVCVYIVFTKGVFDEEVNRSRAEADLAYKLQAAKCQQEIRREEVEIQVVETRRNIEVCICEFLSILYEPHDDAFAVAAFFRSCPNNAELLLHVGTD